MEDTVNVKETMHHKTCKFCAYVHTHSFLTQMKACYFLPLLFNNLSAAKSRLISCFSVNICCDRIHRYERVDTVDVDSEGHLW